jgi:hypothetical protein
MADPRFAIDNPMYSGRAKRMEKSKREQAADLLNAGRKLAREALEEEAKEAALLTEYGPKVK